MTKCIASTDQNSQWPPFCPNLGASIFYAVLFSITFIAHLVQMFWSKKAYSWVICFSAGLQVATYVLRTLSILHPLNSLFYTLWFILMLIAPIFTNAYVYMVMGRMVYNFTTKGSVFGIRAWYFGLIFVLLDIVAFLVQAFGAIMASGEGKKVSTVLMGLHIYMGGIGFQQFCIFLFLGLAGRFHMRLREQPPTPERRTALRLLYVEYAAVFLITVRIIFRLIEYSKGLESSIPQHEQYQYIFDSTLMLFALVLFNIFHPGFLMPGKEANMPARKQRKAMKKEGEKPRGRAAEYIAMGKQEHVRLPSQGSDVETGLIGGSPERLAVYDPYGRSQSTSPAPYGA